ncbi:ParA family protein [Deinococcus psychrotolerans]|uniref:ParA family protein n=1 Tax=Deinococcus psychrotolerans TaxID=2489213 RepID=A0A3G8YK64_9DEIO|nr:ParA family protein [Deinococcus psychrotolerans]AZI41446.1 ParA family protein [Deinococcus psychrotolerans]
MPQVIAVTSEKGGVGKSTLSVHLTGAFQERGLSAVLIDEDGRVGSAVRWARRGMGLPFPVLEPEEVKPKKLREADVIVIDTEGRPKRRDLRALGERADLILVPSGVSMLELDATAELMTFLHQDPQTRRRTRVVINRVPPVGRAGLEAREELREGGVTVCNTLVRSYAAYVRAAELGVLCRDVQGDRAAQAWADIVTLSRELL